MIEERREKKLSSWKGKYMSVGGRLVLINLVLTILVMFMMFFSKFQEKFLKNRLL
jgi:Na+-transporting methylmalonyl-CoA/oxaloacetate decarboxylase gamma subunit